MAKDINKQQTQKRVDHYQAQFKTVRSAADDFERHERQSQKAQFSALEKVFLFGRDIRSEPEVFASFLEAHDLKMNKVTRANPYNALIQLAFSEKRSKAWLSECSNVLAYASEVLGNQHLHQWLDVEGGISARYRQAVEHFSRSASIKAKKLKSSLLELAKEQYSDVVGKPAIPNAPVLKAGFYRSLLYSDGKSTFLVDCRDQEGDAATEAYLRSLVKGEPSPTHPLSDKHLFRLFRSIDLIVSLCGQPGTKEIRRIAFWNERGDAGDCTKVILLSNEQTFTSAAVTLRQPIAELEGRGVLYLDWSDAEFFRKDFQNDDEWEVGIDADDVVLVRKGTPELRLKFAAYDPPNGKPLRRAAALAGLTRHFVLSVSGMKASGRSLSTALHWFKAQNEKRSTKSPAPKRLKFEVQGDSLEVRSSTEGMLPTSFPFIAFDRPAAALVEHRELSLLDMEALWQALPPYSEDVAGYIADSATEKDVAFCIGHTFEDGDQFSYVSPMVISVQMHRVNVCEDFSPAVEAGET